MAVNVQKIFLKSCKCKKFDLDIATSKQRWLLKKEWAIVDEIGRKSFHNKHVSDW